ncbi:hypothetical protein [[Phormidium] sp. ETS-05]|uniref:hypothetical protein n=1 Tax=[Phormidium] sp. ETS-05 TaxID=222819 RepID=UPI0018EEE6C9|nr:hypothetical protein [[Phormidium] sp. ETS-05]
MNYTTLPDRLLKQLETLEQDDLNLVAALVEFLQYKKSIQPPIQAKTDLEYPTYSQIWSQWFEEVDGLEISLTEPSSEYEEGLLDKYRQQGLKL